MMLVAGTAAMYSTLSRQAEKDGSDVGRKSVAL
jgi:hypothetical protein